MSCAEKRAFSPYGRAQSSPVSVSETAERIGALVMRAKDSARTEINQYLRSLRNAHRAD